MDNFAFMNTRMEWIQNHIIFIGDTEGTPEENNHQAENPYSMAFSSSITN
jgi:hypothetical protein